MKGLKKLGNNLISSKYAKVIIGVGAIAVPSICKAEVTLPTTLPNVGEYVDAVGSSMSPGVASALGISAVVVVIGAVWYFAKKGSKGKA